MANLRYMSDLRLAIHQSMTALNNILLTQLQHHFMHFLLLLLNFLRCCIPFNNGLAKVDKDIDPILTLHRSQKLEHFSIEGVLGFDWMAGNLRRGGTRLRPIKLLRHLNFLLN